MALPGSESKVTTVAMQFLKHQGADIVVTNLSHQAWRPALEAAGFYQGPSNFIFAASKKVTALLEPFEQLAPIVASMRATIERLTKALEEYAKGVNIGGLLARAVLNDVSEDPQLPYFIHWLTDREQHPSWTMQHDGRGVGGINMSFDLRTAAIAPELSAGYFPSGRRVTCT
jgi:uncharacterized protein (UPF0147 family)